MTTTTRASAHLSLLVALAAFAAFPRQATAQSIWPEVGENLQELPANFTGARIRAVMMGFTQALGVRCSHCHVGEEGQPLTTYDFVSDENPNKDRARAMLRMLGSINDQLGAMDLRDDVERVNMWCHTCHNGKPRPQTLGERLMEAYAGGGGEAAMETFLELRELHYGGPAYDFRAPSVNQVASEIFQQGDTVTALAFFRVNVEHYPDFAAGWESLGDVAAARGDREQAIRHYEHALELAPNHPRITQSLERVRGG